jgi:hypothetical protein
MQTAHDSQGTLCNSLLQCGGMGLASAFFLHYSFIMLMHFYKKSFVICLAVALLCAAASYWYFDSYAEIVGTRRDSPMGELSMGMLGFFIVSLPLVVIGAFVKPCTFTIVAAQIHAACFLTLLLLISFASGSSGHSSLGSSLAGVIEAILYGILLFELWMTAIANTRREKQEHSALHVVETFIFVTIVITLIGGWFAGVALWAFTLPPKVLAIAEDEADGHSYCIAAAGNPVRSRLGLNALNMYARDSEGYTWHFHGLLIIQEDESRKYMNWSYRQDRFNEISEETRKKLGFDISERCVPIQDFGANLPLI